MIKVWYQDDGTHIHTLSVSGHARFGSKGSDVVCAAVSVLTENLSLSLQHLLEIPAEVEDGDGYYKVSVPSDLKNDAANLLFSSVVLGLKKLADQYPERINFEVRG